MPETPLTPLELPADGWLIYKGGRGWYRPNAQDYTNDPAEAGRYTHEQAMSYSHPNGLDGPRDGHGIAHESEVPGALTRDPQGLVEALLDTAAHLAAAISLLERGGKAAKKAAPSDRMFDQMLNYYRASLTRARAALQKAKDRTNG